MAKIAGVVPLLRRDGPRLRHEDGDRLTPRVALSVPPTDCSPPLSRPPGQGHLADVGTTWLLVIAVLGGAVREKLLRPMARRMIDSTCGVALLGLSARLATQRD